jgi:hypothetical protein
MTDEEVYSCLGISGSRNGCSLVQFEAIRSILSQKAYHTLNTGCCLGVDELVSVQAYFAHTMRIIAFPPRTETFISRITLDLADDTHDPDEYLARNRNIVRNSELMLFVPKSFHDDNSGTWYTMKYATHLTKKMKIFWPTGEISEGL